MGRRLSLTCGDAVAQDWSCASEPCSSVHSASPPPRHNTPAQLCMHQLHCTSRVSPPTNHQACLDWISLDMRCQENSQIKWWREELPHCALFLYWGHSSIWCWCLCQTPILLLIILATYYVVCRYKFKNTKIDARYKNMDSSWKMLFANYPNLG